MHLHWSKIKHVKEIEHNEENYGISLWGFMFEKDFIPYYVGIAYDTTISTRITQHVNYLIGGRYSIIHSSDLKSFHRFKNDKISTDNGGLIYIPYWPEGYVKFLEKRKLLSPHIDNMIDRMCFSFAKIEDKNAPKSHYESVEKYCINKIGVQKLWNRRAGSVNGIKLRSLTGDKRVVNLFETE